MVQLSKKLIRLKSKGGTILYPELGDKTVTREKLVEGNAIPIIVTAEEASKDYIRKYNAHFAGERDFSDESVYVSIKEITSSNVDNYKAKLQNGTPIFINVEGMLIPISIFTTDTICTYPFMSLATDAGSPVMVYLNGCIIDDKLIFKASFMHFYATTNRLIYLPISFDTSSDYTTVTVHPNIRTYYYDSEAESSGKPKYSMGVHGNITFNLDLPNDYEDSDSISYHIELWEYMSGKTIKFPENINFQITPITAFDATSSTTEEAQIQPKVNNDTTGTEITVEDSSNSGSNNNYHMIIDIFFNGKYYLGTIKVIPMVGFSTIAKDSKIKFVFSDSNSASYSDIDTSSGIIGDNGLLYTSEAGEFTYTYKGTKYTPGITIDRYNPINKVIKIYN